MAFYSPILRGIVLERGDCHSRAWELENYGIGKGHKDGMWGQFPDVDWDEDSEFVLDQLLAIDAGEADMPIAGFRKVTKYIKK
jgi:hypothetical protein